MVVDAPPTLGYDLSIVLRRLNHLLLTLLLTLGLLTLGLVPGLGALVEHSLAEQGLAEQGLAEQVGDADLPQTMTLEAEAASQLPDALDCAEPAPRPRPIGHAFCLAVDQTAPTRRPVAPPQPPPDASV